jgi:flavin-dependent dehydrogenase
MGKMGTQPHRGTEPVDVAIIGGGPAGSTVGTLLKQALPAARIVLCERAEFPRHHVGESLLPNANPILAKMGVARRLDAAGFQRKGGVTVKLREGHPMIREWFVSDAELRLGGAAICDAPDHAWQVERSRYDHILLEHARESGVEVIQPASVVEVLRDGLHVSGLVVEDGGRRRSFSTRFVVDCSGQTRFLGRVLGLDVVEHDLGHLAIYRYYDDADWSEDLLGRKDYSRVFFAVAPPVGWVWYIVLSPTLVSVGVVTRKNVVLKGSLDDVFEETLSRVPEMVSLLRSARRVPAAGDATAKTRTLTVSNWSYAHTRVAGPGWYLAGDAAAFVDPVLSSGVMLAHTAGLWVANAILTEINHPEIDPAEIHSAYRQLYEEVRDGFGDMSSWWYSQADQKMDETWVEFGANLMRTRARGAESLNDVSAFMSLVSGRLTDFRFRLVGIGGFEAGGLADVGGGSYGVDLKDKMFGVADPKSSVVRTWDRVERDWYLGTSVEADCWWRLPMLRFFRDGAMTEYRPVVHFLPSGDPDIESSARTIDTVLAAFEVVDLVGDLEFEIQRRQPNWHPNTTIDLMAREMLQDLVRSELVRTGEPGGELRSDATVRGRANHQIDSLDILGPAYDRAELEMVDIGSFQSKSCPFPVFTFSLAERTLRYAPLDGQLPVVESLLKACNGRRTLGEVFGHLASELGRQDPNPEQANVHNLSLLEELLYLGVFEVVGRSDGRRPLPPHTGAVLAASVAEATERAWQLETAYWRNGKISAHLTTPEGALTLEMALATGNAQGYRVCQGVSYWYRNEENTGPPSTRVLRDLDRIIRELESVMPAALHALTSQDDVATCSASE